MPSAVDLIAKSVSFSLGDIAHLIDSDYHLIRIIKHSNSKEEAAKVLSLIKDESISQF